MNVKLHKIVIRMSKLAIYSVVICQSLMMALASESNAQRKYLKEIYVELAFEESTIEIKELIKSIEVSSQFHFAYSKGDVRNKEIQITSGKWNLRDLMNEISTQGQFSIRRINETITLMKVENEALPQVSDQRVLQNSVSGKITDENEEPLPGATIQEKGTTNGTITDVEGGFTLSVPDNAILTISFVGYQSKEVSINGRTEIDVELAVDVSALEEVVVVGYGTQRKADLTGAVGSIRGEDIVTKPFTTPDQALAGTIAGVNITNRSGDPAAPINVRIRGVGTLGNNQPLWVIDGVPIVQTENITVNTSSTTDSNPLAGINPNDIESIDVLKDASAAAIYGARAANGVIIVTTKRGTEGGAARFSYSGYVGTANVRQRLDMLNVEQYIDIQSELGRDLSQFRGENTVDWQDAIFRTGSRQAHNLSVTGGSENANFLISGGYLNSTGIERGQDFERYSVKANSDIKVGKRLRFGESLLVSFTERETQSEGGGLFAAFNAARNAPYFEVYDPSGPFGYNPETIENIGEGFASNRALRTDPRVNQVIIKTAKILGNVYGELELLDGLSFKMSGGLDYNVGDAFMFQEALDFGREIRQSVLVQSRPIERTTNWTNTLTYTKSFGQHNLTALIGYEETTFRFDKVRLQGRDLFNSDIKFASTGGAVAAGNEADQWALQGLLGRVAYGYGGKYLATINVRRDATSRFAEANRDDIFPSFSAGWRISEEDFFPKDNFVDDFKIRAGWGQSGNQFTGVNFAFLSALSTTIFYVVGEGQGGLIRGPAPVNFANEALKWETSTQWDIGFDASFLEGKIDATFDYYNKTSEDVLIGLPLPFVSGYFLPADANIGKIRNSGIELSLSYQNRTGDFTYRISGNFTTVNNEVLDLGSVPSIITGVGGRTTHRTVVGESIGHFYGYQMDGIYQTQEEADAALPDAFSAGAEPGDIRFVDVNGDGQVNADDRVNMGSPIPGFFYGGTLQGAFKGFDLSIQLRGVGDVQVYNEARSLLEALSGNANFTTSVLNHWTGPGTNNTMPRLTQADPNSNRRYSTRWIEDADYMRINNVQLGYTVPSAFLEKFTEGFVYSSRFYFGIMNLATFTGYSGFDPEVTRRQSFQKGEFPLATGQDDGASPQPRIFQFGWQATF